MAELVDAPDLGSGGVTRGGSSPPPRTLIAERFPLCDEEGLSFVDEQSKKPT